MKPKPITIKDIAEQAGVSISTVSYVLNGNDKRVGPVTREKILDLMQALNYRPNTVARNMIKRSTSTIGMVISEVENTVFYPVVRGVEEILRANNYHLVLFWAATIEEEIQAIETLRSLQVDGLIFLSTTNRYQNAHLITLNEQKFPFVVINRSLEASDMNVVNLDGLGVGRLATQHLVNLGHRQIATIAGPIETGSSSRSAIERHEGWRQVLQENNIAPRPEWIVSCAYGYETGYAAVRQLFNQTGRGPNRPTAIFVANDTMAVGVLCALHELNLRVPDDIALVGVGDPPHMAYASPPLTVVSIPMHKAGQIATNILLEQLTGQPDFRPQNVMVEGSLQIRVSCGARV